MTTQPKTFNEACQQIATELVELLCQKKPGYGYGHINAFGEFDLIVRTNDKVDKLWKGKTEPRIDAWRDIAGYAIIALMLDKDWFKLELEK